MQGVDGEIGFYHTISASESFTLNVDSNKNFTIDVNNCSNFKININNGSKNFSIDIDDDSMQVLIDGKPYTKEKENEDGR